MGESCGEEEETAGVRQFGNEEVCGKVGDPCECPKACFTMLGDRTVQEIFSEYWKMADSNANNKLFIFRSKKFI